MSVVEVLVNNPNESRLHDSPRLYGSLEVLGYRSIGIELNLDEAVSCLHLIWLEMLLNSFILFGLLIDSINELFIEASFLCDFDRVKAHIELSDHLFKLIQTLAGNLSAVLDT